MDNSTKADGATNASTTRVAAAEVPPAWTVFGPDPLAERLRGLIGEVIERLVSEELDEVLRARLFDEAGVPAVEWRSRRLPRYARRARAVDDAILLTWLSGTNSRRIRGARRPVLKDAPLSKSAVSRVVRALKRAFDAWCTRRLDDRRVAYLFLDGILLPVRTNRRVQKVPVLMALGVHESGEKERLGLRLMASESRAAWRAMVEELVSQGLREPALCVIDGDAGLRYAIDVTWPRAVVQRCVVHTLRNLEAHCPKAALGDLQQDFHAITKAESEAAARAAYAHVIGTWQDRCEGVVKSLLEAGEELLTRYRFPKAQWKSVRTTNAIERLHEDFRRRIKTQASLPSESSVRYLLFGLCESGQIRMRRLDGWPDIPLALARHRPDLLQPAA